MDIEEIYTPLNRTLLISLHPEYVSAIMNQTKIIEYRNNRVPKAFFQRRIPGIRLHNRPQRRHRTFH